MVISPYSGVGGGSAVQTQLEGSEGPEDMSKQQVVDFWEFRALLASQAVQARGPCATKVLHQEQNTDETPKAHTAVRVVRRCVCYALVASLRG
jgi:hypothetical protein